MAGEQKDTPERTKYDSAVEQSTEETGLCPCRSWRKIRVSRSARKEHTQQVWALCVVQYLTRDQTPIWLISFIRSACVPERVECRRRKGPEQSCFPTS